MKHQMSVGNITIRFDEVVGTVADPESISDLWFTSNLIDVPLDFDLHQHKHSCVISIHDIEYQNAFKKEQAENIFLPYEALVHYPPLIYSLDDIKSYWIQLNSKDYNPIPEGSIIITNYPWGQLVTLDYGKVGYAPGFTMYFVICHRRPISLGRLKLNWKSLIIEHTKTNSKKIKNGGEF